MPSSGDLQSERYIQLSVFDDVTPVLPSAGIARQRPLAVSTNSGDVELHKLVGIGFLGFFGENPTKNVSSVGRLTKIYQEGGFIIRVPSNWPQMCLRFGFGKMVSVVPPDGFICVAP
jgi:hypothetical protein